MKALRVASLFSAAVLGAPLLGGCVAPPGPAPVAMAPGQPSFAEFGEDENQCRQAGAEAAKAAPNADTENRQSSAAAASAAYRYDTTYRRCMFEHGRMRQMDHIARSDPSDPSAPASLHDFEYPPAFYSIPYATPGYGYDGFSY